MSVPSHLEFHFFPFFVFNCFVCKTDQLLLVSRCEHCGKKFKRKYALKQHSYQHGGAPEHKCDICSKAFARTDKLLRHRRRHGIPLNYHCKICLKGFISEKSYLLHESSHMKSKITETSEDCEMKPIKDERQ